MHGATSITWTVMVLVWGLMLFVPRWTRPEIYFGVTVPASFRASIPGRRAYARYRNEEIIHLALSLLLYAYAMQAGRQALLLVAVAWMLAGTLHAFLRARQLVLPHAAGTTTVREAALEPRTQGYPAAWAPFLLVPFAALGLAYRYTARHWIELPAQFPTHWNAAGAPDRWATPAAFHPGVEFLWGAVMALVVMGLPVLALRYSRTISVAGPAAAAEQRFRRAILALSAGAGWMVAAMFALAMVMPLTRMQGPAPILWAAGAGMAWLVAWVIYLARLGQGGARVAAEAIEGTGAQPVGDLTSDRYWKGGLIYINRADPALFVEKRFGIGYTFNFGHPAAWLILAALLALPLAIRVFRP